MGHILGTIVSEVAFVYGVLPKEGAPAEARSYHGYNYWTRNGEYFEYGRWNTGVWVERQDLYGFGWASFIGADGIPYVDWSEQNKKLEERRNCRWGDNTWIRLRTDEVYRDEMSPTYYTWNYCV